ncbi:hypothetical protein CALVIDRAFT_86472 [Calocera viscosa TUFC12733]|uniref:Uncharacterized protein n=1 Tax=Calocera viscosa (strain TUFC12733) TaxID=1330018 RepID=A0A167N5E7_CALVF|nr:hypothetical protein CALVIDRAFT_86472 [Calocera viscosa TUFC12733]
MRPPCSPLLLSLLRLYHDPLIDAAVRSTGALSQAPIADAALMTVSPDPVPLGSLVVPSPYNTPLDAANPVSTTTSPTKTSATSTSLGLPVLHHGTSVNTSLLVVAVCRPSGPRAWLHQPAQHSNLGCLFSLPVLPLLSPHESCCSLAL